MLERGAALAAVCKDKLCSLFGEKFWTGMQFTELLRKVTQKESASGRFPLEIAKSFSPLSLPSAIKQ